MLHAGKAALNASCEGRGTVHLLCMLLNLEGQPLLVVRVCPSQCLIVILLQEEYSVPALGASHFMTDF